MNPALSCGVSGLPITIISVILSPGGPFLADFGYFSTTKIALELPDRAATGHEVAPVGSLVTLKEHGDMPRHLRGHL